MLKNTPDSGSGDLSSRARHDVPSRPFLRMKPQSFFSNRFELEVVDELADEEGRAGRPRVLERLMDWNIALMILVIGVPLLIYCIIATGD